MAQTAKSWAQPGNDKVSPEVKMLYQSNSLGTIISCIGFGWSRSCYCKGAGAFAQLMARDGKFASVKIIRNTSSFRLFCYNWCCF